MRKTFTLSMSWLHTWGGLIVSWALFAVLLTGSIAVFHSELTYWLTPEIRNERNLDRVQVLQKGVDYLQLQAPASRLWRITMPTPKDPVLSVSWRTPTGKTVGRKLDPLTARPLDRETEGGDFYLKVHEDFHIDRDENQLGLFLVGLTGVAMLVACITGIVVHKRIFKDLFLFRRKASPQRAWLDAHNVLSVLALPFHMIMAYTGLLLLYWLYVPAAVLTLYGGDRPEFRRVAITQEYRTVSGQPGPPAPMISPVDILARAERRFGAGKLAYIYVRDPHRANAVIEASRMRDDQVSQQVNQIAYDGVSGREIRVLETRSLIFRLQAFIAALHWIEWGGPAVRWIYFLTGLVSSAMVATGLVVFTQKRWRGPEKPLWILGVEALNVAAVAGLCIACAIFLWAERLIPAGVADRAEIPVALFFWSWLATAAHAALRRGRRAWVEQFAIAGALSLGAPFLGGMVIEHVASVDVVRVAVDFSLFGLGLALWLAAFLIARARKPMAKPVRAQRPVPVEA